MSSVLLSSYDCHVYIGYSFLNNLDRIFSVNYKPNFQDIIHLMPKAQSGISTTNLASGRFSYRFLDCYNQPSKRKWLHQFENILCLVYVVKLDEYDEFDDEGLVSLTLP